MLLKTSDDRVGNRSNVTMTGQVNEIVKLFVPGNVGDVTLFGSDI